VPTDRGIVAAVSGFLFERGANIVSSHQYSSDPSGGRFFMRTEFFLQDPFERELLKREFTRDVAGSFEMEWKLRWWGERQRIAVLVSRHDHCLQDLLWRWRRGELDAEIVAVISNHPDLELKTVRPAAEPSRV
jgi:formyltetrahydrofolate deformylase